MPTYDYRCNACGHTFEEWQSFHDEELTKCPKCKKKKLERLLGGGAAIIFKGSGFYETDYRKESYTDAAKKDTEQKPEIKPDAATETKAEAKPEVKVEVTPEPKSTKSPGKKGKK